MTRKMVMAKQMENEIERLKRAAPLCRDCTGNAVALSLNAR
jgi:hypothetical protein